MANYRHRCGRSMVRGTLIRPEYHGILRSLFSLLMILPVAASMVLLPGRYPETRFAGVYSGGRVCGAVRVLLRLRSSGNCCLTNEPPGLQKIGGPSRTDRKASGIRRTCSGIGKENTRFPGTAGSPKVGGNCFSVPGSRGIPLRHEENQRISGDCPGELDHDRRVNSDC
jgi:hypothetical protein